MEKRKRITKVVDLIKYKKNKTEERKREYERTLFNRILGVYSFIEAGKPRQVQVIDISFTGIKFREEYHNKHFAVSDKVAIRFYCTPSSFLKIIVTIKRFNETIENGKKYIEYGCEMDKQTKSYAAIQQLVSFIHKYAEIAVQEPNPPPDMWY